MGSRVVDSELGNLALLSVHQPTPFIGGCRSNCGLSLFDISHDGETAAAASTDGH